MRFVGRSGAALVLAVSLLGAACAEEEQGDFTADNRTAFLAACTQPLEDTRLTSAICQCVFDETQAALGFERFREIDADLVAQLEADDGADDGAVDELPDDLMAIIAECVVAEAEL